MLWLYIDRENRWMTGEMDGDDPVERLFPPRG